MKISRHFPATAKRSEIDYVLYRRDFNGFSCTAVITLAGFMNPKGFRILSAGILSFKHPILSINKEKINIIM